MNKLIEIAKECGADVAGYVDYDNSYKTTVELTPDQLHAYTETVCRPLVELIKNQALVESVMGIEGKAKETLAAYNAIMGDKK